MQRKKILYLLAVVALLVSMLPLSAVAQEASSTPLQIEEFAASDDKTLDGAGAAGSSLLLAAPDGMSLFNETEPNNTAATANALPGSQAVVLGTITANDYDYFSFTANAGDRVYAAMQTQWSNASGDSRMDVMASDGVTSLEFDDDSGSFTSLAPAIAGTIIPTTGTYYVRVYGFAAATVISPYHLHVRVQSGSPTSEVEPNNDTATATPLAASQWMSGTITAIADPDFFSFTLNAGDSVFLGLDMDPGRVASNTNWNGRLGFGPFNNFILVANDGSTIKPHSEAMFMTVQQAGTYYAYVDSAVATGLGPNARYHLSVSIYPKQAQPNCTTFTSTDVPKLLGPGVGTATSTITVPNTVTSSITDINATIVLTHTNMPDLDVTLVGPTAASTALFTDIGANSQTQMNVGLDDQAALPIGPFTVVSGMINQPEQPGRLATFNGTPAGGVWTLQLADDLAANGGRLQSWSLEICGDPPPAYAVELVKTVGTEPAVCAVTDSIAVPPGVDVYYCYTVHNIGLNAVDVHDLVDSELGTLFTGMNYLLAPGASYSYIEQASVVGTVTNSATWTAHSGANTVSDSDTATVTVRNNLSCPAGYQEVTVDFSAFDNPFPPAGWSVTNTSTGCGALGVPEWTNTNPGSRANLTGGVGPFAIGDSDRCGSGSVMDTMMTTGLLDFTGMISPTLSYNTDYYDLSATTGATANLGISLDGGGTWNNLLTWNGSHRGPLLVTQALTGAAGENDVQVRWHYAQAAWDFWWQVDNAFVTACEPIPANPAITLDKTVGTDPNACAVTDQITVPAGTEVTYCYEVTNTGDVEFNTHTLVDSELGTILSNFPYTLSPGASAFITETTTINATTVNTATWTASDVVGASVQATDAATVTVQTAGGPEIELTKTVGVVPAVCAVTDNITITAGTQVYYCYQVENTGTVALNYHDLVDSELGVLANDLPYALGPGATHEIIVPETPMVSVTNTATWTAMTALGAYVYDDTVAFNYIPINATGTPLGLADDGEANITLPFSFTFYGVSSSNLRVGNNGGILFNATTGEVGFSNVALPNAAHPLAIFPFWDDMDSDTGDVYWEVQGTAPNRMAIIEWYNRPHYSNVGAATFEVILYEGSNEIKFQYLDTDFGNPAYNFGVTATSGLNKDGTTALQYSYNQPVLTNNKAILFYEVIPQSATDSDSATVTVQTPNIDVDPLSLTETHLTPPQTTNQTLTVANTGQGTLTWNIVEEPILVRPARLTGGDATVAADVADASSFKAPEQMAAAAPLSDWRAPDAVLYDNGPLVTHPGGGAGGADASALQTALGLTTYGAGNQMAAGNRVADDFTVTGGGWFINTMTFFGYQTGSGTTSTFTALNLRIWDGPPNLGSSNVVFGDTTTNRLASSTWANMYRVLDTGLLDTARPVMANVATVNTFLPAGTYWVDWQADGTLASGPWAPPISILGQTTTGNAWQFTSTGWAALVDGAFPQGLPFIVDGLADCSNPADVPWLSVSPTSGSNAGGSSTPVTVGFDSTSLANGTYTARLCVFSNDPNTGPGNETGLVIVPVTLIVGDPTAVTLDGLSASPLPAAGLPVAALPAAIGLALGAAYALRRRQ
jgi:subtilisin-like proprotein convertase family protein